MELQDLQYKKQDHVATITFDNPEKLDLERKKPGRHLAFGSGVHHCLGAHLGRLEARCAFDWLIPKLTEFDAQFDDVRWNDNWFVRGPESLSFTI